VPAVDAAELDQNLLGLVQEFYVEKTLEEERLERMQQRATTSYFPPSFRQSKDLSHDSQMGSGSYRADLFGPDDQSDYSGNDAFPYPPLVHHASDGLPTSPGKISHLSSGFELDLSPTHSNKHSRRPSQHAGADSAQYSSQDILAAVAAVARSGADKQAPGAVQGQGANAQGGAAPAVAASATPTRRLSLKMEQMLSRRNSYNPTEVRLELLKSIHSPVSSVQCLPNTPIAVAFSHTQTCFVHTGARQRAGWRGGQRGPRGAEVPQGETGKHRITYILPSFPALTFTMHDILRTR
jgi:hypothetical protein